MFSYFTPPKESRIDDLKLCYDNETAKKFVFNGIANLGLNPDDFDFKVEYVYDESDAVQDAD